MHSNTTDAILSLFSVSLFSTPLRSSMKSGETYPLAFEFAFISTAVAWLEQDPLLKYSIFDLGHLFASITWAVNAMWFMTLLIASIRTLGVAHYSYIETLIMKEWHDKRKKETVSETVSESQRAFLKGFPQGPTLVSPSENCRFLTDPHMLSHCMDYSSHTLSHST